MASDVSLARAGSQRWIQVAVNHRPEVLLAALQRAGAISSSEAVTWASPLLRDGYKEYRDARALHAAGIGSLPVRALSEFWPARGPVWDAIGTTTKGQAVFVEAKAHIAELASPGARASAPSMELIARSLDEARRAYAPRSNASWSGLFYQYGNRLAHHYLVRRVNRIPSALVFVYFVNATEMEGPATEPEWRGAIRLLHTVLGLPVDLTSSAVFDAFVDVRELRSDRT